MVRSSIFKSGLLVGLMTFISRILGFIRDILITSTIGISSVTDCFNIAFRLPNFFRRIFAEGAFNSAFIPIFNQLLHNNSQEKALSFANQVFTRLWIILLLFVLFLELILPVFIYILAPGYLYNDDQNIINLAVSLSRITLPYLILISLVSLIGSILNSLNKFTIVASLPIILNICLIMVLIFSDSDPADRVYNLAWGVLVAGFIQLIIIWRVAFKMQVVVKFDFTNNSINIKKLVNNMLPSILGGGIVQINILIDQAIASFLGAGSISVLIYADRINQLPLALIGTAIGTVLLPNLSKQVVINDFVQINNTMNRAIELALFFSIPASTILILCAPELTSLIYEYGKFSSIDTNNTANVLRGFATGLPAYIMIKVLTTCFFANLNTRTPVKISIYCLVMNIIISLLLIKSYSYVGIAIATASSAWLNVWLLTKNLIDRGLFIKDQQMINNLYKIIISSLIMICCVLIYCYFTYYQFKILSIQQKIILFVGLTIVSAVSFFLSTIRIFKIFDFQQLKTIFKKNK